MKRGTSGGALLLMAMTAAALPALAQSPLNPTVTVLARASSPVPPECETGTTTIAPRAEVADAEPATPPSVAPSSDLGAKLRRLQAAAMGDDYEEFNAALASARTAVASYPPGGERSAANQALAVHADIERLWNYANSSKTGSFFDATAENGALLAMLNRYSGFGRATAEATMEVGGQTVYPTRESRQFLAGEAGQRLARMGIRAPARVAPAPAPQPAPQSVGGLKAAAPQRKPQRPRKLRPIPTSEPPPVPQPPPEPAPVPEPVVTTTTAEPVPVVTATQVTTTQPTITQPTTNTAPAPEKPPAPAGRVNLLLALILIVVGLGVLIFLFRASD
jgi:hypothetical protein